MIAIANCSLPIGKIGNRKLAMTVQRLIITILSTLLLFAPAYGQKGFRTRVPPPVSSEAKLEMEAKLKEAQEHYKANPNSADAIIWVGRRQAYLGQFVIALDTFSKVSSAFRLTHAYRHRGHREITLRRFDPRHCRFEESSGVGQRQA